MNLSQLRLSQLEFGALLTYAPHGSSAETQRSKDVMYLLKKDGFMGKPQILMSKWIAKKIQEEMRELPFASFFGSNTILVPAPKSSLMQPNTLWVPERIAAALIGRGIGKGVSSCLVRVKAVPKAAYCAPQNRPTAADHYASICVQGELAEPDEILLIDDVVTRGATLIGAANKLADAFPTAHIRAFAAMRTISNEYEFQRIYAPCVGTIDLWETGETYRRP
jgi:predicted amidophosphoribosyltransferase